MGTITDKAMQANATTEEQWLTESFGRGAGALLGRITPAGSRVFYFRYAGTKGQVRLPIGPFHPKGDGRARFTVGQARAQAMTWVALRRDHHVADLREFLAQAQVDSQQAAETERKRAAEEQRQVEAAALAATELQPRIRADGKRVGRKDGGQYVAEQFTRHVFPLIGNMVLEDVRKADLFQVLDAQTTAGKARTANVLLSDLKQMLDFALERELIVVNPLATVKKAKVGGKDVERERVLSEDEVRHLVDALPRSHLNQRSIGAVWVTLATGVRVGELMGAVWSDFAIGQFERLRGLREALTDSTDGTLSPWVFPATNNARPVCIKSFGKQLADRQRAPEQRLLNRSKATTALMLPGGKWTAHDLRRTAGTLMARLGFSTDTINECLNHITADRMARVYIHDRREADQARAFDALGAWLSDIANGNAPASNVRMLRAG
ncbi:MAG: tyrosine-type recombinase/integrase [Lautropia sp.]|nr:tyrosine-type recombinase/integrase [Lautropia sp.]